MQGGGRMGFPSMFASCSDCGGDFIQRYGLTANFQVFLPPLLQCALSFRAGSREPLHNGKVRRHLSEILAWTLTWLPRKIRHCACHTAFENPHRIEFLLSEHRSVHIGTRHIHNPTYTKGGFQTWFFRIVAS